MDKVVHPILETVHLPVYHANPEFHTSFAWCLLPAGSSTLTSADEEDGAGRSDTQDSPFTDAIVAELDSGFADTILAAHPVGGWTIRDVTLKVGKDISTIPLSS